MGKRTNSSRMELKKLILISVLCMFLLTLISADQNIWVPSNHHNQTIYNVSEFNGTSMTLEQNASASWFNGLFNWVIDSASSSWLQFTGSVLSFNETHLNLTIDARATGGAIATFINYTSILTTGNISNGSLVGYAAGTAICDAEISGSHMCTMDEVLDAQNNNRYNNFTATFRVSEGAPGFTAEAADCGGWKSDTTSSLGAIWVGDSISGGAGALVSCSASRAIGCCK